MNKQYWGKYQPAGISNGGEKQLAGKTLREMIAEARGYVELFLEDLENEETAIEEPQEKVSGQRPIRCSLLTTYRVSRSKY